MGPALPARDESRVGFGEIEPDRGDRVSSPTTRAAIGLILRGGAGFLDQSRCAARGFCRGEREGVLPWLVMAAG